VYKTVGIYFFVSDCEASRDRNYQFNNIAFFNLDLVLNKLFKQEFANRVFPCILSLLLKWSGASPNEWSMYQKNDKLTRRLTELHDVTNGYEIAWENPFHCTSLLWGNWQSC
jgi:hypothetical protein